ncbi:MAG TPA: prepilin-type N-terminal cleavage/methylation domain-containing protein, partial [Candidatus Omnitrophota bacterium]|nr:prepilin-type N-terminal cleavage/methylation domain-containing protein [Candidatus Omnitrophota bacterium]
MKKKVGGYNKLLSIKQLKKGGMIPMLNRKSGFTLVEIMIVVAIIALLAAVAIPNLLGAKKSANQAAAKANTKTLCTE